MSVMSRARDHIATGFCKNALFVREANGAAIAFCAVGALQEADYDEMMARQAAGLFLGSGGFTDDLRDLYTHLPAEWQVGGEKAPHKDPLGLPLSEHIDCVVAYNNAPERTQAEMVALFEKVLADRGEMA